MVTPAARREAAGRLQTHGLSQRRACAAVRLHRSTARYPARPRDDAALRGRLRELAALHPRYGHPLLHALLRREGLVVNRKRSYRIYREEQLSVRRRTRSKLRRERLQLLPSPGPGRRLSLDFVSDQLSNGRRFRVLNVIDDFTRECVMQVVDTGITGERVARELKLRGLAPAQLVCDNGPEFTSKALFLWARDNGVQLAFIQPGKPQQNGFVESFNGKFREGCLSAHWFRDLSEARELIEVWRVHYNTERPHSSLGYLPPAIYAQQFAAEAQPAAA